MALMRGMKVFEFKFNVIGDVDTSYLIGVKDNLTAFDISNVSRAVEEYKQKHTDYLPADLIKDVFKQVGIPYRVIPLAKAYRV